MNRNQVQKVIENRQEIIRTASDNNLGTTQTEITETTETIEDGGTSVMTVKKKVVTISQGHEHVIEDSQLIVDANDTAFKSVVDHDFVVVDREERADDSQNHHGK